MKKKPLARAPRPQDLPGVDHRNLADIEAVALDYAEVRDRRMALTKDEAALKQQIIGLLKHHKKTTYRREGLELAIVPGEERLRVRVTRADNEAPPPDEADDDVAEVIQ
jgi:hypothetical protein